MTLAYSGTRLSTTTSGSVVTTYTFDSLGRRLSQASSTASATYAWDARADRLLAYSHRSAGVTDVTASYVYDAAGMRTRSVVSSGGATTTTTYVYEGLQLLRMVATTGSSVTTLTYLYEDSGRPSVLAAQVSTDPVTYFLKVRTTSRGDVIALSDTAASPVSLKAWHYDEWGNPQAMSPAAGSSLVPTSVVQVIAALQPLRYAGYVYDAESGLYYCAARYFDPATMQFISADPVGADGEASEYQYCAGDPVNRVDPSGLMADFYDTGRASSSGAAHSAMNAVKAKAAKTRLRIRMEAAAAKEKERRSDALAQAASIRKSLRAAARFMRNQTLVDASTDRDAAAAQRLLFIRQEGGIYDPSERPLRIGTDLSITALGLLAYVPSGGESGGEAAAAAESASAEFEGMLAEVETAEMLSMEAEAANCFVRGTPVLTVSGLVPIEALKPGDRVLTGDPVTGRTAYRPVVRTMVHKVAELVHVRVAGDDIVTTPNHPFWVEGRGWTQAGQLAAGDRLVLADGERADIVSVTREKLESPVDVYNIEVAEFHTYFVASAGVWVHNCGGGAVRVVEDSAAGVEGRVTGSAIWNNNHVRTNMADRGVDFGMIEAAVNDPVSVEWVNRSNNLLYEGRNHVDVVLTQNGTIATTWVNPR